MADLDPDEVRRRVIVGSLAALAVIGEDLLGKAVDLAPLQEGTLRGSGTVAFLINGRRFDGEGALAAATLYALTLVGRVELDVEVSFNTIYAARQHEELDWHHPIAGQAKYLEQPLRDNAARYAPIIAAEQRRHLAR